MEMEKAKIETQIERKTRFRTTKVDSPKSKRKEEKKCQSIGRGEVKEPNG